jgi:DNA-binding NarL/FixJ family response regulator
MEKRNLDKANPDRARVLVVDDHTLFRQCLTGYLAGDPRFAVVGETGDAESAVSLARAQQPHVALVDIDLGHGNGIHLTRRLRSACEACAVVILTADRDENSMREAARAGAHGYLTKDVAPANLLSALERAVAGEPVFPPGFTLAQLHHGDTDQNAEPSPAEGLTRRELEVLQLLADGGTDKEVARRLHIAENTVKNHMKRIRAKLAVDNRLQATMRAIALGLIARRD